MMEIAINSFTSFAKNKAQIYGSIAEKVNIVYDQSRIPGDAQDALQRILIKLQNPNCRNLSGNLRDLDNLTSTLVGICACLDKMNMQIECNHSALFNLYNSRIDCLIKINSDHKRQTDMFYLYVVLLSMVVAVIIGLYMMMQ